MLKADEFHRQGQSSKAQKHWQFALSDVAGQALKLKPLSDGPKGNVQIWREDIARMQQEASDWYGHNCAPSSRGDRKPQRMLHHFSAWHVDASSTRIVSIAFGALVQYLGDTHLHAG
jgi:hypothetical protein